MKLCLINPTEMHRAVVYELAKYLVRKKNYEIIILQPSADCRSKGKMYSDHIFSNIETIYLPSFFLRKLYYTLPNFCREFDVLCKLVSELGCEIIQACNYFYLTSIVPIFVKKKSHIPIILTENVLPGYTWFYGNAIIDSVAKLYTYSVGRWVLNSYDRLVLLTKKCTRAMEEFGVPREKISRIPNGIDLESFKLDLDIGRLRDELSIKQDDKVLLFIGRLAQVKRVEIIIALTKLLLKDGFNIKTIIVGDGPSREYYEKLAEPIKTNVIFTGWLHRKQTFKYYHIADVFVLPSLSEGLPTVLLEASATGKPCVASNVGGISDIVLHEQTGYLVDRSKINLYAHYVKTLLTNDDLSRKMGQKATEYVEENFNWDTIVNKYDKMYRQIVNHQ